MKHDDPIDRETEESRESSHPRPFASSSQSTGKLSALERGCVGGSRSWWLGTRGQGQRGEGQMVLFCICPVAADGDERERRVGGEREREREREKGGSMSFSRFGNTTYRGRTTKRRFQLNRSRLVPTDDTGTWRQISSDPRDYRAIAVYDVAADPFTFV